VPPQEPDARLLEWTIMLPDVASLKAAEASLARHNYFTAQSGESRDLPELVTRDPWGTHVRLRTRAPSEIRPVYAR